MLSYDDECSANYVSGGLVKNYPSEEIHQLVEKEDIEQARSLSHEAIAGFVELKWCLERYKLCTVLLLSSVRLDCLRINLDYK